MNVGDRIKYFRKAENLSQDKLASKSGLSRNAISNYELNKRQPNIVVLKKIADALKVDIDDLIIKTDSALVSHYKTNLNADFKSLKKYREEKKLSQEQLSYLLDIDINLIKRLENGEQERPNAIIAKQLNNFFNPNPPFAYVNEYVEYKNTKKSVSTNKDNNSNLINKLKKSNNSKTYSYKLNEKEVNEINKLLVTSFMKFVNNIGLDFFNDLTSNEVLNIINSEELYKTLEYLYFKEQSNRYNSLIKKVDDSLNELKTQKDKE